MRAHNTVLTWRLALDRRPASKARAQVQGGRLSRRVDDGLDAPAKRRAPRSMNDEGGNDPSGTDLTTQWPEVKHMRTKREATILFPSTSADLVSCFLWRVERVRYDQKLARVIYLWKQSVQFLDKTRSPILGDLL